MSTQAANLARRGRGGFAQYIPSGFDMSLRDKNITGEGGAPPFLVLPQAKLIECVEDAYIESRKRYIECERK